MTTLPASIPDSLARQVQEFADHEHVSVDMIVSIALASQVAGWQNRDTIAKRAARGSWDKLHRVMEKVRQVPPLEGDEVPWTARTPGRYTWWTYRGDARGKNIGWRLDYWGATPTLGPHLTDCHILPHILGSDHCPVWLETHPDLKF